MGDHTLGPDTSQSLLIRIRNLEDAGSWELFESLYRPVVQVYCRRRGIQPADIDDIAQNVMTRISNSIQKFQYDAGRGTFRAWLATITANELRAFIRKRQTYELHVKQAIESFAKSPTEDQDFSRVFLQRVFEKACEQIRAGFNEQTWQCFVETWLRHRSPIEVADQLGVPIQTVYVNKSRVLKRLEQELALLCDDIPLAGWSEGLH